MPGEILNAPAPPRSAPDAARNLPRSLIYSILARIGGSALDTDAFETLRASYRGGFLGKAIAYGNRQNEIPGSLIHSLRWHPVRRISFLVRPHYYGAKKNYVDWIKVLEADNFLGVGLDAAKRASNLFPNSAAIFNLKGSIESRLSQFTDAITSYKHSVDIQSTSSEGWFGQRRAQVSAGLILDATSTFTSAMERFPKEMRLKVVYAEMLLKHADPSDRTAGTQAEQLLKQAVANDATNPEAFFELGKIELDDGRLTDASQHLERAAKLLPQSSQVHYVLSRAYRRLNRTADAQRELETFQRLERGGDPETQNG
jgi:tetratricopeptide (TPR) repeat protein